MKANVVWKDGMAFEAHLGKYNFTIDAVPEYGGRGLGPSPKGLTLISLAGCTGLDVVSILQKMRVKFAGLEIATDAEVAPDHPKKILSIVINYKFTGDNLPLEKIRNAITLSLEGYCGVSATLAPTVNISHQIFFNGEKQ